MSTLHDRIAIVTGASRGAGRGIAVELGAAGATVYVTGRSTRTEQPAAYAALLAQGSLPAMPGSIDDTADEVTAALDATGFDVAAVHAVRVFVDLVPSSLVDQEPGAAQALVDLERAVATRPEYLALATQVHVLATRR